MERKLVYKHNIKSIFGRFSCKENENWGAEEWSETMEAIPTTYLLETSQKTLSLDKDGGPGKI